MTAKVDPTPDRGADRRVDERRPFRSNAMVLAGGQEFLVRTLDISRSGMSIVAAINPQPNLRFKLRVRIDRQPQGAVTLETEVQVMHSVFARQESGFRIGLRFVNMSAELSAAVGHFLK